MSLILAIESSCDEMAMAILKDDRTFLSSVIASQIDIHASYGGVVPEIASRKHVECVSVVLKETLEKANVSMKDIDAITVTKGPGLVGSLHIGLLCAKSLCLAYNKPLIGVHHIVGHIYANQFKKDITYPSMCLVISGGHTELVLLKKMHQFEVIATTLDDAVGEAYDKVGRVLNLPYPGGPVIDKYAHKGIPEYKLPLPLNDGSLNFSFSGLKSAVINLQHNATQKGETLDHYNLATSFQNIVIETLLTKTIKACKLNNINNLMLAGGVSANKGIREAFIKKCEIENINLSLPPLSCCGDNAMMIALAAKGLYDLKKFDDLSLSVVPNSDIMIESVGDENVG